MTDTSHNTKFWREALSSTSDCASLEELEKIFHGASPDEKSAKHVARCPHCQADLAMIRSFESPQPDDQKSADAAWIVARLSQGSTSSSSPTALAAKTRSARFPYIAGGMAAIFALVLGVSIFERQQANHPGPLIEPLGPQTVRSSSLSLVAPSGSVVQTPGSLQWEAFPGVESYSIEVTEVDGSLLWSGESSANVLVVGPDLARKLHPNRTFIWKVIALDSSGKRVAASNPERFIIKPVRANRQ